MWRQIEVLVDVDMLVDTVAAHRSNLVDDSWVVIHLMLLVHE